MADTVANGLDLRFQPPPHQQRIVDAGGTIVSPRGKGNRTDPDLDTAIIPLRPSQAAIDRVYQVKQIGIGATIITALLLPGIPAIFYMIPWWGEHISVPESRARIAAIEKDAESRRISAEAISVMAKNGNAQADVIKAVAGLVELIEKRTETEQKIPSVLETMSRMLKNVERRLDQLEPRKE